MNDESTTKQELAGEEGKPETAGRREDAALQQSPDTAKAIGAAAAAGLRPTRERSGVEDDERGAKRQRLAVSPPNRRVAHYLKAFKKAQVLVILLRARLTITGELRREYSEIRFNGRHQPLQKFVRGANAGTTKGPTMVTPGPGAYSSANQTPWESPTKSKASSTASFQSKSQRLGELKLRKGFSTPGPGAYAKQDPFALKQKTNLRNSLLKTPPSNKIRWTRLPTAPSIPTVSQSFGYEQGPYGKLVRHEPAKVGHTGRGDDTLGPGEYEPMKGLKSVNKSRTTDFSKGKVARFIEQEIRSKADVPGPGEYSASGDVSVSKDAARISAVFKSSITREQGTQPNAAKNVPGPGAYHSNQAHSFAAEPKPEHLQFFGSTVTRFKSAQRSKTERFESPIGKDQCLAAPGSYEVPSAVAEVLNKVRVPETLESQLERDMKEQESANHRTESVSKTRQQKKASSMFASSTSRPSPSERATGPSPGDYEVR
ncbi:hypothetical protein BBJ28_00013746 [Nothophytophthora sp. Chile5]|nr:hypothetical protein BBJ28_00013746 [Nothophytophthora sp. Chile5]